MTNLKRGLSLKDDKSQRWVADGEVHTHKWQQQRDYGSRCYQHNESGEWGIMDPAAVGKIHFVDPQEDLVHQRAATPALWPVCPVVHAFLQLVVDAAKEEQSGTTFGDSLKLFQWPPRHLNSEHVLRQLFTWEKRTFMSSSDETDSAQYAHF